MYYIKSIKDLDNKRRWRFKSLLRGAKGAFHGPSQGKPIQFNLGGECFTVYNISSMNVKGTYNNQNKQVLTGCIERNSYADMFDRRRDSSLVWSR